MCQITLKNLHQPGYYQVNLLVFSGLNLYCIAYLKRKTLKEYVVHKKNLLHCINRFLPKCGSSTVFLYMRLCLCVPQTNIFYSNSYFCLYYMGIYFEYLPLTSLLEEQAFNIKEIFLNLEQNVGPGFSLWQACFYTSSPCSPSILKTFEEPQELQSHW